MTQKNQSQPTDRLSSNQTKNKIMPTKTLILPPETPQERQKSKDRSRTPENRKSTGPSIAFGSTLDRTLFPHKCAQDRTGNELTPLRGSPNRGPGVYNNHLVSSFIYQMDPKVHPCSTKGYYLNRTEKRFFKLKTDRTPAPNNYQEDNTALGIFRPEYKPFASSVHRFQQPLIDPMITPGPGSYDVHKLRRNRKVSWPQEFGGRIDARDRKKSNKLIKSQEARLIFRVELDEYKRRLKRENRLAYFKLYFEDDE